MQTTLTIDNDLLAAARRIASERGVPLDRVIEDLVRQGLRGIPQVRQRVDLPVFSVPPNAKRITLEDVKRAEDEA